MVVAAPAVTARIYLHAAVRDPIAAHARAPVATAQPALIQSRPAVGDTCQRRELVGRFAVRVQVIMDIISMSVSLFLFTPAYTTYLYLHLINCLPQPSASVYPRDPEPHDISETAPSPSAFLPHPLVPLAHFISHAIKNKDITITTHARRSIPTTFTTQIDLLEAPGHAITSGTGRIIPRAHSARIQDDGPHKKVTRAHEGGKR